MIDVHFNKSRLEDANGYTQPQVHRVVHYKGNGFEIHRTRVQLDAMPALSEGMIRPGSCSSGEEPGTFRSSEEACRPGEERQCMAAPV